MFESSACITKEDLSTEMTSGDLVVKMRRRRKESHALWRLDVTGPLGLISTFFKTAFLFTFQEDRKYFQFQFDDPSIPFRNLSELALWREDEMFTDQRLAGSNPMLIQRVSRKPGTNRCHVKKGQEMRLCYIVNVAFCKKKTKQNNKNKQKTSTKKNQEQKHKTFKWLWSRKNQSLILSSTGNTGGVNWAKLRKMLNSKFNWKGAILDVLGIDISLGQVCCPMTTIGTFL